MVAALVAAWPWTSIRDSYVAHDPQTHRTNHTKLYRATGAESHICLPHMHQAHTSATVSLQPLTSVKRTREASGTTSCRHSLPQHGRMLLC